MRKLLAILMLVPALVSGQQLRTMTRSGAALGDSTLLLASDTLSSKSTFVTRAFSIAQARKALSKFAFDSLVTSSLRATNTGSFGGVLTLNGTGADIYTAFQQSASTKAFIGVANAGGGLVAGSSANDLVVRSQNQAIRFSTDAGSTSSFVLAASAGAGTFNNGLNVSSGTTAVQALTATTGTFAIGAAGGGVLSIQKNTGPQFSFLGTSNTILAAIDAGNATGAMNFYVAPAGVQTVFMTAASTGNVNLSSATALLTFGGTSSTTPGITFSGTELRSVLADNSNFANFKAAAGNFTSTLTSAGAVTTAFTGTGSNFNVIANTNGFAGGAKVGFQIKGGGAAVTEYAWDFDNSQVNITTGVKVNGALTATGTLSSGAHTSTVTGANNLVANRTDAGATTNIVLQQNGSNRGFLGTDGTNLSIYGPTNLNGFTVASSGLTTFTAGITSGTHTVTAATGNGTITPGVTYPGITMGGNSVVLLNNGTFDLNDNTFNGVYVITAANTADGSCMWAASGSANLTFAISMGAGTLCSNTLSAPGKISMGWNSGTAKYRLANLTGGTLTFYVTRIGNVTNP